MYHMLLRYLCYVCWWCNSSWTVVVVACVIFIPGFSQCRGYWIWVFCRLFVVCIYMFGWLCRATYYFLSTSMFGITPAVQNEKKALEFTYRVIVEVLVLGLLVVVYKIPYSCCMWTRFWICRTRAFAVSTAPHATSPSSLLQESLAYV